MIESKRQWNSVANKQKWAARGASLVAKVKATKLVWFPPKLQETGKKTASTAAQASEDPAKKAAGAAEKTTSSTKKVIDPTRQK